MILSDTHKQTKITLVEKPHLYRLRVKSKALDLDFEIEIRKSKIMQEWKIAYLPVLYKSAYNRRIVLHNTWVCDIEDGECWALTRPWQKYDLNDDAFAKLCGSLHVPSCYKKEITKVLGVAQVENATLDLIHERWDDIPTSLDMSKWRFLPTIQAIFREELWKRMSHFTFPGGLTKPTVKQMRYEMKSMYRRNIEWISSDFKKQVIANKVQIPLQMPEDLRNVNLVLTSTPQSEKAGKIASIPLGMSISKEGYAKDVPDMLISLTSKQCPFPQRMAANREVVMCALDQNMHLEHEEPPLVEGIFNA